MKAAQVTGGTNNNGNGSSHSGLLGGNGNLPPTSPGPQSQNMMQGRIKLEGKLHFIYFINCAYRISSDFSLAHHLGGIRGDSKFEHFLRHKVQ